MPTSLTENRRESSEIPWVNITHTGDSSIYEALVVMEQDFKKGMALVDGHGKTLGSIEGDGAAAMRYTEARLKKFTQEVYLKDLDKDIINFLPNFDETEKEPEVLPVRVPNLLCQRCGRHCGRHDYFYPTT